MRSPATAAAITLLRASSVHPQPPPKRAAFQARLTGLVDPDRQPGLVVRAVELTHGLDGGPATPSLRRHRIEHNAPTNCHHRRVAPNDEPVARGSRIRRFKAQLHIALGTPDAIGLEHGGSAEDFGSAVVETQALQVLDLETVKNLQPCIDHVGRLQRARLGKHHSSSQLLDLDALKVQRRSLSGDCTVLVDTVHLNASNCDRTPRRQCFDLIADCHAARNQRSGDDGSEARHGEDPVDRQAQNALCWSCGGGRQHSLELILKRIHSGTADGAGAHDRRAFQVSARE